MHTKYHIQITERALEKELSKSALATIITANIRQDRISHSIGHDHIHFDGSAFDQGFQYITNQENVFIKCISSFNFECARQALGRMIHSWQDFYSHSNYIKLWLDLNKNSAPESIVTDDPVIMNHPKLQSGKNYGVIEFIAMLPGFSRLIRPLMPGDSHARMNLDQPSSSPLFIYAYWAAFKKTKLIYDGLTQKLISSNYDPKVISAFKGQQ